MRDEKLKKQVTIRLGEDVIAYFKSLGEETGIPYKCPRLASLWRIREPTRLLRTGVTASRTPSASSGVTPPRRFRRRRSGGNVD